VNATDLAKHYSRFRVSERILLTGHSHQAWPDVAFAAQQRAWLDAAEFVDDKWERAAGIAERVRAGWRRRLTDPDGDIALGQNTHELVVRLLSAVLTPGGSRRTLVTTTGEFHSVRRQLDRLAEVGVEVRKIAARPVDTLAERVADHVDDGVAAVLLSSVLFETAEIVPDLAHVASICERTGTTLLIDAYHHLNVVPFDLESLGLTRAFVVGGGYKYCQLGEGNGFLRVPANCEMRPVITGWFSEFGTLAAPRTPGEVRYGAGAARFAGATYDPTSHYRAAAVFEFHDDLALTPTALRRVSMRQTARIADGVRALDLDPRAAQLMDIPPEQRAGFVVIDTPFAAAVVARLRALGVFADARGRSLRVGPAPYISDQQLDMAVVMLEEALRNAMNPKV
jgi:kynureninase